MKRPLIIFFATGTYTGFAPFAPGTFGTLWGVAIAYLISGLQAYSQGLIITAVFISCVFIAEEARKTLGGDDPSAIVCDEALGYLVSIFLIPFSIFNVILVFLLFRFFDILKPYPAGYLDRNVKGGLGIVLDDAAAGVYANLSANLILWALR